jgi:hypothetical protein
MKIVGHFSEDERVKESLRNQNVVETNTPGLYHCPAVGVSFSQQVLDEMAGMGLFLKDDLDPAAKKTPKTEKKKRDKTDKTPKLKMPKKQLTPEEIERRKALAKKIRIAAMSVVAVILIVLIALHQFKIF